MVGTGECGPAVQTSYTSFRRRQHSHLPSTCEASWHEILVSCEHPSRCSPRHGSDNRRDMPDMSRYELSSFDDLVAVEPREKCEEQAGNAVDVLGASLCDYWMSSKDSK